MWIEFRVWKSHFSNNPLGFKSSCYWFLRISLVNTRGPRLVGKKKGWQQLCKGKRRLSGSSKLVPLHSSASSLIACGSEIVRLGVGCSAWLMISCISVASASVPASPLPFCLSVSPSTVVDEHLSGLTYLFSSTKGSHFLSLLWETEAQASCSFDPLKDTMLQN